MADDRTHRDDTVREEGSALGERVKGAAKDAAGAVTGNRLIVAGPLAGAIAGDADRRADRRRHPGGAKVYDRGIREGGIVIGYAGP